MELTAGDLVKVPTGGPVIDGIVVEVAGEAKAIVAVMDRERGPVLRTVATADLAERTDAGADDRALQLLAKRTPRHASPAARGGAAGGSGRAGHKRASMHRTTGK
jgi:hypothetical protein